MVPVHIEVCVQWHDSSTGKLIRHAYFERVVEFPCLPPRDIPLVGVAWGNELHFDLFQYDLRRSRFEAYIEDDCTCEEEFRSAMQEWLKCGFTAYTPSIGE